MAGGFSGNFGKYAIAIILMLLYSESAFAVDIETVLKRKRIRLGEHSELQIKVSGSSSVEPVDIPRVDGLIIRFNGKTRTFQFANGRSWSGNILSYDIIAERGGKFSIPPVTFRVDSRLHRSKPVLLIVRKGVKEKGGGKAMISTEISISKRKSYVGEPIILRYFLLHAGVKLHGRPVIEKLPETRGFVQKGVEEIIDDSIVTDEGMEFVKTHVSTFVLIPAEHGSFEVGRGSVVLTIETADKFFSFPRRERVVFGTEHVTVMPIPEKGKPDNFQGNVGSFSITMKMDNSPIKKYEEKSVSITIKGDGNFFSMSKPFISDIKDIKIISGSGKEYVKIDGTKARGEKEFVYTMIPEKPGIIELGSFTLNYFNPSTRKYEEARTEVIVLNVTGNLAEKAGIPIDRESSDRELDTNILFVSAIVIIIIVIVAAVFIWERKKYGLIVQDDPQNSQPDKDIPGIERRDINCRDLLPAMRQGDEESFFRSSGRIISEVEKRAERINKKDEFDVSRTIAEIKERLYNYRYGGGNIDKSQMEKIYEEIKGIILKIK